MPKYKGVTKRELVFDTKEELLNFVNQHIAGDNIIYSAYTSTTKGEYPMEGRYKAHVTIDGVSGADISSLGNGTEQEVLYPRDILFDVTSVSLNGNEATIYLKEIYDGRVGDGTQVRETETNDSVLFQMQASEPGQTDVQSVPGGNTVGNNSREGEARTAYPGGQRNTVRAEITNREADYYEHKDNNVGYGERPRLVENPTGRDLYRPGLSPEVRYEQSIRRDGRNRRDVLSDAKRSLPGTETGTEITNEAGAESPGFSNGE